MINLKNNVISTIIVLFVGIVNICAQEKEPQTVIIKAFEYFTSKPKSYATVVTPDGSIKSIELFVIESVTFKGNADNNVILQSEINIWKKQGFSIDGFSNIFIDGGVMVTTIILSKTE